MVPTLDFKYRENMDGTIDSICLACLETVASSDAPANLKDHERDHICNPHTLLVFGDRRAYAV
jgi:hypothetical protein